MSNNSKCQSKKIYMQHLKTTSHYIFVRGSLKATLNSSTVTVWHRNGVRMCLLGLLSQNLLVTSPLTPNFHNFPLQRPFSLSNTYSSSYMITHACRIFAVLDMPCRLYQHFCINWLIH